MKRRLLMIVFIELTIGTIFATSWSEADIKCPICKTTNKFAWLQSWGSENVSWQIRLQHISWLDAKSICLYTCKKCRYSAFMWDFNSEGKKTLKIIKKALPKLKLPASNYSDNVTKKLESAELIYNLYKHDTDFWCRFYRIKGYHYENEGNTNQAKIERLKALEIADSLLTIPENGYRRKELLFITSSMKYFTNQDSNAIKDIDLAMLLTYNNPNSDSTENRKSDSYLTRLLNELKMKIIDKK